MNWEQLQGQATQVGGKLKEKWSKLTDNDLMLLKGKKDVFMGKFQERTGFAKDEAEKQFDAFVSGLDTAARPSSPTQPSGLSQRDDA